MSRLRKFQADKTVSTESYEIVDVWIMRALVDLGGQKEFVRKSYFSNDALAKYLGLEHWVEDDNDDYIDFDPSRIRKELKHIQQCVEANASGCIISAPLRVNTQRLAHRFGLSEADCRILEFVILLHSEQILQEAVDLLGDIRTKDLPVVLSVLLKLPIPLVNNALRSTGALVQPGLALSSRCK